MSSTQVDPFLRFIRQLAAGRKDSELPDHQLLERFATLRDEAAFTALLRRHGPMVLSVCQSVLHNLHDAEDVFQAAFLVLAQKAASIHRREAVSSWLYRVAYHLAVKAQASAARRKDHEKRAAVMPSAEPLLDMSLRELQSILNEELQRLPEQYRAPLVLCGIEEKSLEEAARLLGWSKGCVKGRLQRGREQLRARLRRRGLELSVSLLASALATNSMSAQVSATLTASTLRAALQIAASGELAAGAISANVAALVQGAMPTMFFSKFKIVTLVVLAIGVSAAGLGALSHREIAAQQAAEKPALPKKQGAESAPTKDSEDLVTIEGQTLDPDGKPLAGVNIYLLVRGTVRNAAASGKPKPRATSAEDGTFRFRFSKSEIEAADLDPYELERRWKEVAIVAVATGYGPQWVEGKAEGKEKVTLKLVRDDVPIDGQVVDLEGRPVAGAKVAVQVIHALPQEDLSVYVKAHTFKFRRSLLPEDGGLTKTLTTGEDGRFRLTGVGRERMVDLAISGKTIEAVCLRVLTRTGVDAKAMSTWLPTHQTTRWMYANDSYTKSSPKLRIYGAKFTHQFGPTKVIAGTVRDKAMGKPIAGMHVYHTLAFIGEVNTLYQTLDAVTDRNGRYRLVGFPKRSEYQVQVSPEGEPSYWSKRLNAGDSPYLDSIKKVRDTEGMAPITLDFDLVRGVIHSGQDGG